MAAADPLAHPPALEAQAAPCARGREPLRRDEQPLEEGGVDGGEDEPRLHASIYRPDGVGGLGAYGAALR
jgi:hypothetical protein